MLASDDWEIGCSDDEKYEVKLRDNGQWEPDPPQVIEYLERLANSEEGLLSISWVCPGRRPPTPEINEDDIKMEANNDEGKEDEKDDYFDFEIEKGELCLRPSGDVGPRGSAKKKTTSLDAILSNMARHRRMDMLDQDPESQS
uniref:PAXIP1-associated protein 1 n=1 Tax=Lygus hesperus TaxID=30085 RepID=A0A146M054_LYGHE